MASRSRSARSRRSATSQPRGVSVAAMVPSLTAVDDAGVPLRPGLLYGDERGHHRERRRSREVGELAQFLRWHAAQPADARGYWMAQAVANHALTGRPVISTTVAATAMPLFGATRMGRGSRRGDRRAGRADARDRRSRGSRSPRSTATTTACSKAGTIDAMGEQIVAGADEVGDVLVILGTTLIVWAVVPDLVDVAPFYCVPHTAPGASGSSAGRATRAACSSTGSRDSSVRTHRPVGRSRRGPSARRAALGAVPARRTGSAQRLDATRRARRPGPHARRRRRSVAPRSKRRGSSRAA